MVRLLGNYRDRAARQVTSSRVGRGRVAVGHDLGSRVSPGDCGSIHLQNHRAAGFLPSPTRGVHRIRPTRGPLDTHSPRAWVKSYPSQDPSNINTGCYKPVLATARRFLQGAPSSCQVSFKLFDRNFRFTHRSRLPTQGPSCFSCAWSRSAPSKNFCSHVCL